MRRGTPCAKGLKRHRCCCEGCSICRASGVNVSGNPGANSAYAERQHKDEYKHTEPKHH
jgi:hypothetical protein